MEKKEQHIPEKYRFKNWQKPDELIFSYDTQGWPQFKQTIRDALIGFGCDYNEETGKWEISDNDPRLDTVIRRLTDDGMGMGVNEEYVMEINTFQDDKGDYYCNMFTEKETPDIKLWRDSKFYPGAWVKVKEDSKLQTTPETNHFMLTGIWCELGTLFYEAEQYCHTDDGGIVRFKKLENLIDEEIDWDD